MQQAIIDQMTYHPPCDPQKETQERSQNPIRQADGGQPTHKLLLVNSNRSNRNKQVLFWNKQVLFCKNPTHSLFNGTTEMWTLTTKLPRESITIFRWKIQISSTGGPIIAYTSHCCCSRNFEKKFLNTDCKQYY